MSRFSEASVRTARSELTTFLMWEIPITARSCCRLTGRFGSIALETPAAAWHERELHDQYGIEIVGHPDLRPLIFHENWPDGVYPMIDRVDDVPWSKREYRFLQVQGEGIAEVAVGPVHAGIIEPGHFRFSVVGRHDFASRVAALLHAQRHRETFRGRCRSTDGAMLAESVSGDNCFAHAVCYSQAVENACGIDVPPRALAIRLIGLELERLVCHISDVGGLCTDVGFGVAAAYATRIKESLLRASAQCCGTRYWRGIAVPGGLRFDLDSGKVAELGQAVARAHRDFSDIARLILETPSIQNRFETAGILSREAARDLAVVGPVARASGIDLDVRRDHPYGGYGQCPIEVPVTHYGDVMARARIRIAEAAVSAQLIQEAARSLPDGSVFTPGRLARRHPRIFCGGIATRGTLLLDGGLRRPADAVSHQVSVVPELACDALRRGGQHHRGFSADQQELQPFLLGM